MPRSARRTLADVPSIDGHSVIITNRRFLIRFIEQPLLAACRHFFDLNIRTIQASASQANLWNGEQPFLTVDPGYMSEENRVITREVAEVVASGPVAGRVAIIRFPAQGGTTVAEISAAALTVARRFKLQSPTFWARTLEEMREILYENGYADAYTMTEAQITQKGFPQDPDSRLFYLSKEMWGKELAFRRGEIYHPAAKSKK